MPQLQQNPDNNNLNQRTFDLIATGAPPGTTRAAMNYNSTSKHPLAKELLIKMNSNNSKSSYSQTVRREEL